MRLRALRELVEAGAGTDDYDSEVFNADGSASTQWIAAAGTAPFLSPRRTVVVRNLCRSDAYKEFRAAGLPETALLILVGDEETTNDADRQRKLESNRTGWEKAVAASGGEVMQFRVGEKDLRREIKLEIEGRGKKINDRAADVLKEMTGGSFSRALEEIEKLVLFTGEGDTIFENDVRSVVVASTEWNVFKLIDAVVRRDAANALQELRNMIGGGQKAEEVALRSILPLLSNQLRSLWQARVCVEAGAAPPHFPPAVAACFPVRGGFDKELEWRQNKAMHSARSVDFKHLARNMQAVADADARLKGLLPSFNARDTLERMVLEMVASSE